MDCFGNLSAVFPEKSNGLREVPESCMNCTEKILCLKKALETKDGILMKLEKKPVREKGFKSRIRRWSEKKSRSRLIENS